MYRTHTCGQLRAANVNETVTLAGWVQKVRNLGAMTFIDLRDRYGITQIVVEEHSPADVKTVADGLGREYVLQVEGRVVERSSKNPKMPTGDIEVVASKLVVLHEAEVPPFTIEENSDGGDDLRMKYRYLDLRRPPLQRNMILRHKMAQEIRRFLSDEGFLEIETPYLVNSTPEGARDFVVPSRMSPNQFYALPQSPQTLKQLLMVAGYDKYFQIVRCFRDEDLRADRQPEFTQIDCEMSFVEQEDVLEIFERWAKHMFRHVMGIELTEPLRELYVMAYSLPSIAAYLYKSTTKRLQVIFGPYLPEAQPKDFYEMEIASASIMRGFMSVPCDVYFTMEAKISRFLDCALKLYDVPKEKRAAITAAVLQIDLHTMALGIIQKTVRQAEKGFEALTEKQI